MATLDRTFLSLMFKYFANSIIRSVNIAALVVNLDTINSAMDTATPVIIGIYYCTFHITIKITSGHRVRI